MSSFAGHLYGKKMEKICLGSNRGLWQEFQMDTSTIRVTLEGDKVKAHVPIREVVTCDRSLSWFVGNSLADAACGSAAEDGVRKSEAAQDLKKWETLAFDIALRIATLEAEAWEAEPMVFAPA